MSPFKTTLLFFTLMSFVANLSLAEPNKEPSLFKRVFHTFFPEMNEDMDPTRRGLLAGSAATGLMAASGALGTAAAKLADRATLKRIARLRIDNMNASLTEHANILQAEIKRAPEHLQPLIRSKINLLERQGQVVSKIAAQRETITRGLKAQAQAAQPAPPQLKPHSSAASKQKPSNFKKLKRLQNEFVKNLKGLPLELRLMSVRELVSHSLLKRMAWQNAYAGEALVLTQDEIKFIHDYRQLLLKILNESTPDSDVFKMTQNFIAETDAITDPSITDLKAHLSCRSLL